MALHEQFEKIDDAAAIGEPEHHAQGIRVDRGDAFAGAMCDRLVEKRQRIAHRALGGACDKRKRLVVDRDGLLGADRSEIIGQHPGIDAAQIESLAARADGDRNLFDLGRREDEFHMIGRLFQSFQEAVESLLGQHMHFVDDIDLRARHDRPVARALDDLAHIVDPGMRGGVHLDDIDMARIR